MNTSSQPKSRIDTALDKWGVQEQKYADKYGQGIYQDKVFIKARRDSLQKIFDDHKKKPLTFEEKMDMRILKGQIKQMNKMVYPNPTVRVIRGVISFISRPLIAPLKMVADFISLILRGRPAFNNKPPRMQPMRVPQMRIVPIKSSDDQKKQNNNPKNTITTNQQDLKQLRRPVRERKISESPAKGMSVSR